MAPTTTAAVFLAVLAVATCEPVTGSMGGMDLRLGAKQIVATIREVAVNAKEGIKSLDLLHQDVLDLQAMTSDLLSQFPNQECETQAVIKMAAAATGSHEVLTLLLAEDPLSVLSGRLAMSLAVLEHIAQQLEDELTLSSNVEAHLTAVIFGTNVTAGIIESADKTVKQAAYMSKSSDNNRVRRQLRTSVDLGRGWSVGLGGVNWNSRSGRYSFNARPTFTGLRPTGARATFTIRF